MRHDDIERRIPEAERPHIPGLQFNAVGHAL